MVHTQISPPDLAARPRSAARPRVGELAGLAGAGKSTIALALARLDPDIRTRPRVPVASHLASVPALLPTFVSLHWPFRGVRTKQLKRMLRVRALHRFVHEATGGGMVLFDEGPVYMLARMLVFGGDSVRTRGFERWWRTAIAQWAATLDCIVWVEAPDEVLAARIHTRPQPHPFQGADDRSVGAFLRAYREAFGRVLAELHAAGGPAPWTVWTDRASADQAARSVLARCRSLRDTSFAPEPAR